MVDIVRGPRPERSHALYPDFWVRSALTDFWMIAPDADPNGLQGWTATGLVLVAGSGADFISSADVGTPAHFLLADASDSILGPPIFGDYAHALVAKHFLDYLPTKLTFHAFAAFLIASNNENNTGFGLLEAAGTPLTAADHLAYIVSDGTNFVLRSGAASDVGAAVDTSWHEWKIVVDATNCEWFIDDVSQGTIATETDVFPCSFGTGVRATTGANDVAIAWVHVSYE